MTPLFAVLLDALDRRLGVRDPAREVVNKPFPSHWSFLLGEVALVAFAVLVATGIYLTMFYRPSAEPVLYTGSAELFAGRELPAAYESIVRISHDVPGGLLVRRIHRGASHLFLAVAVAHLLRVVLTGAFRRPREVNYLVGFGLLLVATVSGYTGHNLPYDTLAGTSLRVAYSFFLSIPWAGDRIAYWIFGGPFPTGDLLPRMFVTHVMVLPAVLIAGIGVHLAILLRQTHTQPPRPDVDVERRVVGEPAWPNQFATTTTLLLAVTAVLVAAAVLVPWSDVDLHGPFRPAQAVNASQPDWFLFWVEGALRLYPPVEFGFLGATVSGPFLAGIVLPLAVVAFVGAYPFLERRWRPDPGFHHANQHPLDVPLRAGVVAAMLTFLAVLTVAAGNDVIAWLTGTPTEVVIVVLRAALLVLPPLAGWAAVRYARAAGPRWTGAPHR